MSALTSHLRAASENLLRFSVRISPQHLTPWGEAMLGEFAEIPATKDSFSWALGSSFFLWKQTAWNLIVTAMTGSPPSGSQVAPAEGGVMKRLIAPICVLLSLCFLFSPVFRQGLQMTWSGVRGQFVESAISDTVLLKMAEMAEREKDADTLAFVATQLMDPKEKDRLATEATQLNPELTWIYYVLVHPPWGPPDAMAQEWNARLRAWDPENAVPLLQQAEISVAAEHVWYPDKITPQEKEVWTRVMLQAFISKEYDSYQIRRFQLVRRVLLRHELNSPAQLSESFVRHRFPPLGRMQRFTIDLVARGDDLQKEGKLSEAMTQYWTAAHFAERLQSHATSEMERFVASNMQRQSYRPLVPLLRSMGRADEAQSLQFALDQPEMDSRLMRSKYELETTNHLWNAALAQITGIMVILTFITVVVIKLMSSWKRLHGKPEGLSEAITWGCMMLLVFCCALYASFRPFAATYSFFMTESGITDFRPLYQFIVFYWTPFRITPGLTYLFWMFVLIVGAAGIVFYVVRRISQRVHPA